MRLDREQCIDLTGKLSKSGIDVFELQTGPTAFLFRKRGAPDSPGEDASAQAFEVLAPALGILRTEPGKGEQAYAQPGQAVSENDIICAIEVLDRRHPVPAGARGVLAALCAGSGDLVEYGQRLAVILTIG